MNSEYFDSSLRSRIKAFDRMVEETEIALTSPAVVDRLGAITLNLRAINQSVFLPNIRHDRIVVHQSLQESNRAALLPLDDTPDDLALKIDKSFANPGRQRLDIVSSFYQNNWPNEKIDQELASLVEEGEEIFESSSPVSFDMEDREKGRQAMGAVSVLCCNIVDDNDKAIRTVFHTRPLIIVRRWVSDKSTALIGSTVGHEYMHTYNAQQESGQRDLEWDAIDELWGYEVSSAVKDAYWSSIPEDEREHFEAVSLVENLRKDFSLGSIPTSLDDDVISRLLEEGVVGGAESFNENAA